jgi:hypothetical protein
VRRYPAIGWFPLIYQDSSYFFLCHASLHPVTILGGGIEVNEKFPELSNVINELRVFRYSKKHCA